MTLFGFLDTIKFITKHPLTADQKGHAIMRYLKWQIVSRMVPGDLVFDWINGARFVVRNGETGMTGNIYTGLHEFTEMGYVLHVLRPGDLFVDIGANVGAYTILGCKSVGADGVSIEPILASFNRLMVNIAVNHMENRVKCYNLAIGAESGRVSLTMDHDTMNHVIAADEATQATVDTDMTTLDDLLNNRIPQLIKIDVEGYEQPVLTGARAILQKKRLHSVIVELNGSGRRYGYEDAQIFAMMAEYGFAPYRYDPFQRSMTHIQRQSLGSNNVLFIRDTAAVKASIRCSPVYEVNGKRF